MGLYVTDADFLVMEYASLHPGGSLAGQLCPSCRGGSSGERSLSVSRDEKGTLLWMCHRACCSFKGKAFVGPREEVFYHSPPVHVDNKEVEIVREPLPQELKELLNSKYKLVEPTLKHWGLAWTSDYGGRVILPVKSYSLDDDGVVLRSHSVPVAKPKTLTKITRPNSMAWFLHVAPWLEDVPPSPLVIVEDIYSALRLWQAGISSIALLGTHINEDRINEIAKLVRQYPHYQLKLALDYDAFAKAIAYVAKYRHLLKMEAVKITIDIKDMSDEQLEEFLSSIN